MQVWELHGVWRELCQRYLGLELHSDAGGVSFSPNVYANHLLKKYTDLYL